uniref:Uncharacterized protein n=1 Tax=Triticum urartu TaxID=4572 RepID=A0A8R7QGH1_TRIUA
MSTCRIHLGGELGSPSTGGNMVHIDITWVSETTTLSLPSTEAARRRPRWLIEAVILLVQPRGRSITVASMVSTSTATMYGSGPDRWRPGGSGSGLQSQWTVRPMTRG